MLLVPLGACGETDIATVLAATSSTEAVSGDVEAPSVF